MRKLKVGDKVTYLTPFKKEKGIVKSLCENENFVFVVYHCGQEWNRYQDYTAARTHVDDLFLGW